jgi:hypothetical protein
MTAFAQAKRTELASNSVDPVGPGNYDITYGNIEKSLAEKRGYTMRARNKSVEGSTKVPGPGNYTPVIAGNSDTGTRIGKFFCSIKSKLKGTAKRLDLGALTNTMPGPGQYYDPDKSSMQKVMGMFGKDIRSFGAKGKLAPGPGQYDMVYKKNTSAAWGFGSAKRQIGHVQNKSMTVPGPGTYNSVSVEVNSRIESGVKYSMGNGSRVTKNNTLAPGPGNYNYTDSMDKRGVRMGTEMRKFESDKKANPGPSPGTYEIKSSFPDVAPYSMG